MNLARQLTPFLKLIFAGLLALSSLSVHAWVGSTIKDSEQQTAWLRTPTATPDASKSYWLVVSVHGAGANGEQAIKWLENWKDLDDVIIVAPTFLQTKPSEGGWLSSYQMSAPAHEAKLFALIAEIGKTWKLRPKIILNGFSAGAQFAHRFTFHHPELVAAVAAHSPGSWAKLDGDDRINPDARRIPFAVSCGEEDRGRGSPDPKAPTRIEGARQFAANIALLGFDVDLRTWPAIGHEFSAGANAQTLSLLERVRAGNGKVASP
jgi:poly(3-hydroxybutyrate) depolymerase